MNDENRPEALRLADDLDAYHTRSTHRESATELRRLHKLTGDQAEKLMIVGTELAGVTAQLNELITFMENIAENRIDNRDKDPAEYAKDALITTACWSM